MVDFIYKLTLQKLVGMWRSSYLHSTTCKYLTTLQLFVIWRIVGPFLTNTNISFCWTWLKFI